VLGDEVPKGRIFWNQTAGSQHFEFTINSSNNGTSWTTDDTAKPSWLMRMSSNADAFQIYHAVAAASPTPWLNFFNIDNAGKTTLTLANNIVTSPMLQYGTTVRTGSSAALPVSNLPAKNTWVALGSTAVTLSGPGHCIVDVLAGLHFLSGATGPFGIWYQITANGVAHVQWLYSPGQSWNGPLPSFSVVIYLTAGTWTIQFRVYSEGGTQLVTTSSPGHIIASALS
jgi:hypothetical protein